MLIVILLHCVYLCLQCCAASCDIKNTFDCYEPRNISLLQSNVSFNYDKDIKFNETWEYLENGDLNFTMYFTNNVDIKLSYIELRKTLPENETECVENGPPYLHSKYTCRDIKNFESSNLLYTKKVIYSILNAVVQLMK